MHYDERADVKPGCFSGKSAHVVSAIATVVAFCGLKDNADRSLLVHHKLADSFGTWSTRWPCRFRYKAAHHLGALRTSLHASTGPPDSVLVEGAFGWLAGTLLTPSIPLVGVWLPAPGQKHLFLALWPGAWAASTAAQCHDTWNSFPRFLV